MRDTIAFALETRYYVQTTDIPMCHSPGCDAGSIACTPPPGRLIGKALQYYCPTHASERNYCCGCGAHLSAEYRLYNPDADCCDNCIKILEK